MQEINRPAEMGEVPGAEAEPAAPLTVGEWAAAAGAGFGTSGVRACVVDLTPGLCAAYTQAFLDIAGSSTGRVLIGHDLRPSSPRIAAVCLSAAREMGYDALYAGVLPTPALAFAAQYLQAPAIMVTGSHIPFDRNGLKFFHPHGEITKLDEQRILAASVRQWNQSQQEALPGPVAEPLTVYLARYLSAFAPDALAGMRVGVYEHSSAARDILHQTLQALGAETLSLGRCEAFVAIDTEAVRAEDVEIAPVWALRHKLDAIVTTDGDADRPLVADENGVWLRGDILGMICARELGARSVVTPITSNSGVEGCGLFQNVHRTRVGSPYVIAAMEAATGGPLVGYEANGGFLLGSEARLARGSLSPLMTRDAMLPVLLALTAARRESVPVSELRNGLGGRHTHSGRLQDIDPALCEVIMQRAVSDPHAVAELLMPGVGGSFTLDQTDGIRFTFASGDIIHLRLSGNAPELRCYAEAASPARAADLCRSCLERLRPYVTQRD